MMLNFKSVAGDPMMPFIGCSLPTEETDWCSIYEWKDDKPEINGQAELLFLGFKGDSWWDGEQTLPGPMK